MSFSCRTQLPVITGGGVPRRKRHYGPGIEVAQNEQQNEHLKKRPCSDPNNESDPSSEYSPLGLTHVMNQYLGQKFTTWVKINCLDTILKPRNGIP